MDSNRERMRDIFDRARRLPKAERATFLDGLSTIDVAMRAQIEEMLEALHEAGVFLSEPTQAHHDAPPTADSSAFATMPAPLREGPGTRIGPYRLLQLIGEGGFGSVFMAEQEKPVQRMVALKIIKLGMDTRQVVARFEQERQALAMMDHPNIARVLDAGATETGRPFFVMELVKGDPIVDYCDKSKLSIQERLELFAQVCHAVQYAHTKGIIHRDIKPSNILVSTQDGRSSAKVIDFGIAKATQRKLTEKTLFTEYRQLIGTPEYMSPEQAEGSLDIDTRTDVYALGVLLYELLTGTTPLGSKELRSAAYAEIQRIIREVEPPKPSTRLSANTDNIASVAAQRHTEPKRLGTIVRGELDWIVMKALEKDRQRRYETANGLALDIHRYLAGEAVGAAPPSTSYRFKKFIRRNRATVTFASAVAGALLIGVVAFAWQAKVARDQRDIAVHAREAEVQARIAADSAKEEAKKQTAIAEAVAKFQTDMLAAADPDNLLKENVTVLQVMEAAVKDLDKGSLKDQPLVEAGVRDTIGNTFQGLGRYDEAEPNLRKSLAIRRAALPPGHPDIATSLNNLASLLQDKNKLADAEPLFREAIQIYRAAVPPEHANIASSLDNLAWLLQSQNRIEEADPLYREAISIRRASLPAGHPDIAKGLNNLASLLQSQNKLADAEPLFREALAIRRAGLPAAHPDVAAGLNNLASVLQAENKLDEAEPLFREAVQIFRASLPPGHPDIARALNNLASLLKTRNKLAEAEPLFRESLAIRRAALPAGHPDIAISLNNLAWLLQAQNKPAEAEPLAREALALWRAALPAGHPTIAKGLTILAGLLQAQGKLAEAEPLFRDALAIRRAALPAGHPDIADVLSNLARVQHERGKTVEAHADWDESIAILRKGAPDGSALLARVLWCSGSARLQDKEAAAALPELEEAVAMAEKILPPEHPQLKEYRETLAKCRAAQAGQGDAPDAGGGA
jgi:serine/threonine protein kinase/tetratricopeptide (TPR) repeat protein